MTDKRGKYSLEVPLDASGVGDLKPDEQQDLRVAVQDASGATRSTVVKLGKERKGTARLDFEGPPGALTVHVGPATATDEELLQSQTITIDVGSRRWANRTSLVLAPVVIAPYWWFWWLRWCREFVIRGRLVCPDGSPIPGATVCAFDVDWWFLWSSTQQVGCATTDVNGAFEIRFRWCCGFGPWWWWKNRVWTLDDLLVERVGSELATKPDLQLGRIGGRPSLEAFGDLLGGQRASEPKALEAADVPALAGLREELLAKLPASPELTRLHIWPWWPWWPWWDCTPDIIFKVTQECEGSLVTIVDETVADTRWEIPTSLSVTLVAGDKACCRPPNGGGDECLVLDSVCGIPLATVGGNPGAPAGQPDGYAPGDRPFAGTVTITKNPGDLLGVDYVELEMFDSGTSTWVPLPAGAELAFNRHYWEPGGSPPNVYPYFPVHPLSGRRVWETREHYEAASGATWFPDAGWTRVWMSANYSLLAYLDTSKFSDGTHTFRAVGWQDGGGGTIVNPKVIPVCGKDDENQFVLTFDNQVVVQMGHPASHNCGGVHICTLEPDTHISGVKIGGVSIDPCDIAKPEGAVEIDFEVTDPDGHLSYYTLIATYGLNQSVDLLAVGTISIVAGTEEGPTYADALAQGATSPHWSGGKYRLTIPDAALAFPEPCCYQLELRAYKRTIVNCGSTDHRNLTEYSIGVGIC